MSWTKRQILDQAFAEIGMAGYVFDLEAEDVMLAVRRLDSMLAAWESDGIRLGYPLASNPDDTDPDQASNIPDDCVIGVYQALAVIIAPTIGKAVSRETATGAKANYNRILTKYCKPVPMQFGKDLPRGAGNKPWRGVNQEYFQEGSALAAGQDGLLAS